MLAAVGCTVVVDGETLRATPPSVAARPAAGSGSHRGSGAPRGYDRLPDTLQGARPGTVPDHAMWTAYHRVREAMVAAGLHEVRPLPFTSGRGTGADRVALVRVQNPLAEDEPFLRATVLDTLARRAEYNLNRMTGNVRLFEVGSVFRAQAGSVPVEEVHAALLVMGQRRPPHFTEPQPPAFDAWDAKALAVALAQAAYPGVRIKLEPADDESLWHIVAAAARVGAVRRVMLDAPVWASPAFGVELLLGAMPSAAVAPKGQHAHGARHRKSGMIPSAEDAPREPVRFRALPSTPAAEFDLALLVPESLPAADVEKVLRHNGGELLERCVLFDEFRGKGLPAGMRSLAWRLTFRHPERTLRDKEIEGRRAQLLKTLESELGVRPRTA